MTKYNADRVPEEVALFLIANLVTDSDWDLAEIWGEMRTAIGSGHRFALEPEQTGADGVIFTPSAELFDHVLNGTTLPGEEHLDEPEVTPLPTAPGLYVARDFAEQTASAPIFRLDFYGDWSATPYSSKPESLAEDMHANRGGLARLVAETSA